MATKYGIFVSATCAGAKTIGMEILKQCVQGWKSHNYAEFRPFFIFGTLITDRVTGYGLLDIFVNFLSRKCLFLCRRTCGEKGIWTLCADGVPE